MILVAMVVLGQIAPECMGVGKPANYSEEAQQSYLQNYFAAGFLMTPLSPAVGSRDASASIGVEVAWIPPLSCAHRLVLDGTKTENPPKSPVNPRLRLQAQLPRIKALSVGVGLAFLPPIRTPLGVVGQVGAEISLGWYDAFGVQDLAIALRGHYLTARVRAEIATPFIEGDPAVEDLFTAQVFGGDLDLSWRLPGGASFLTPYLSGGIADVSTMFIVGDDNVIVQNVVSPWWGALISAGFRFLFFGDHLELVLEGSYAIPLYPTVKVKLAGHF